MLYTVKFEGFVRYHTDNPESHELEKLQKEFNFHELVQEDLLELSSEQGVNQHGNLLIILINFLKYNKDLEKYILNESTIIVSPDYIISALRIPSIHLNNYIQQCISGTVQIDNPLQVLYRILTVMYDKTLHSLQISGQDVFRLQESMIYRKKSEKDYLENLLTQKINMIAVMHNFKPHRDILSDITTILKDKSPKLKIYRKDLSSKLKKMISSTEVLFDTTDALINSYNALLNMNTNNLITRLTIFTAIIGACNLIVGTYGMNIPLPGQGGTSLIMFGVIAGLMLIVAASTMWMFHSKR